MTAFTNEKNITILQQLLGNKGCGSVGILVASATRDPRFESSLWQYNYIEHLLFSL